MEHNEPGRAGILQNNLPGVAFVLDEDLAVAECTRGFGNLVGEAESDCLGADFAAFLSKDRRDIVIQVLESAEETYEASVRIPFIRTDGTEVPVLAGVVAEYRHGRRYIVCSGVDISVLRDSRLDLEKSRREMEERYCQTLDELMEGCQIIDFDWKYIYVNEAAARHGRRPRQDYQGKRMQDLFPGIERSEAFAHMKRCMTERVSDRMSADLVLLDGSHGQFEFTFRPVPEGVFILSQEVSDKIAAEERSREMERRLESVVRNLPGMTFRCGNSPDWPMEFIGGGCFDLTGYAPEELIGDTVPTFGELILPEDRGPAWLEVQKALKERRAFSLTYRIVNRRGHERWLFEQGQGVYGEDGSVVAVEGYVGDITSLRMAEKAKRDTEERYRMLVENLGDILFEVDLSSNRILFVSPSSERILGYRENDVVGRTIGEFLHPDDMDTVLDRMASLPETKQISVEFRSRHLSGEYLWFSAVSRLIRESSEDAGRMVGTMTDITDRRSLEEQLRQAQKLESVGILAGGVAHDFNNYLAVVMMYGEYLTDKIPEGDPAHAPAREILEATKRAAGLTRQLLAFSRKQPYSPEIFDLNEIVRRQEKMLQRLIGENISFHVNCSGDPVMVKADPVQMEQVVMNLVVNARDAMPEGGRLSIATEGPSEADSFSEQRVFLRIADTGVGMDESVKARIFEPFFTTKGRFRGTGLGLSTVYGIIKQVGGDISVESRPDSGTEFTIALPATRESPFPGSHRNIRPGKGESILVVEDEQALKSMISSTLESLGYKVAVAGDPQDALAMIASASFRPDLLLTDIIMPEMDGITLAEAMKERLPGLKTVLMSGYLGDDGVPPDVRDGSVRFLEKPFDTPTLSEGIRAAFDGDTGDRG